MLLATLCGGLVCYVSLAPSGTVEVREVPGLGVVVRRTPIVVNDTGKSGILGRERGREIALAALVVMGEPGTAEAKTQRAKSMGPCCAALHPATLGTHAEHVVIPQNMGIIAVALRKIGTGGPGIV